MANSDERFLNIFAIPNGGYRCAKTAGMMKAEGVKSGVWDIAVLVPHERLNLHGLMVEMKRPGEKLSPAQKVWQKRYAKFRYARKVAESFEQFKLIIETYFEL